MFFAHDKFFIGGMLNVRTLHTYHEGGVAYIEVDFQADIAKYYFGAPATLLYCHWLGDLLIFLDREENSVIVADCDEVNSAFLDGLYQACYRRSQTFAYPPFSEGGN